MGGWQEINKFLPSWITQNHQEEPWVSSLHLIKKSGILYQFRRQVVAKQRIVEDLEVKVRATEDNPKKCLCPISIHMEMQQPSRENHDNFIFECFQVDGIVRRN